MAFNRKPPETRKSDYYENLASLFIKAIKENKAPWQKPWRNNQTPDYNYFESLKNNKMTPYKGANALNLPITRELYFESPDPRWGTFYQMIEYNKGIKDEKEHISLKKGSIGTSVIHCAPVYIDKDGKIIKDYDQSKKDLVEKTYLNYKTFVVFHASQFFKYKYNEKGEKVQKENGEYETLPAFPPFIENKNNVEPDFNTEELIKNTNAKIIHDQQNSCYFQPSTDSIHMVPIEGFNSTQDYYDTLLHELTHWTGHPKRLNRSYDYQTHEGRALEELTAEIGGFLLCKEAKLNYNPTQNNMAYIQSWGKQFSENPEKIREVLDHADAAKDLIISYSQKQTKEQKEEQVEKNEIKIENKGKARK